MKPNRLSDILLYGLLFCVAVLSFTSCMSMSDADPSHDEGAGCRIVVRGTVVEAATLKPVSGIKISLSAYRAEDHGHKSPIMADIVTSDDRGMYELRLDGVSVSWSFIVKAEDAGKYTVCYPYENEIFLDHKSPSYNSSRNEFVITGTDIIVTNNP